MEACGGAHYWAREFTRLGHEARLMLPQFVKPYVKGNKNDDNDVEGICEAVSRPNMRFVGIKAVWQQDIQALHRIRSGYLQSRTRVVNRTRGLLAEYGIVDHPTLYRPRNGPRWRCYQPSKKWEGPR